MAKRIITALLLFTGSSAFSQINYVLNPDFEIHTGCPPTNDSIKLAKYWSSIDSNSQLITCKPDYCHRCANGVNLANSVPASMTYWQYPHSGDGMAQVMMLNTGTGNPAWLNYRDYLQGRLYKKLINGKSYCISFYVCLEEASSYAVQNVGAYLDNGSIDTASACGFPQTLYDPQIVSGTTMTDTMTWTKIEGSFVATGQEQFITIGNFKSDANTTKIAMPLNNINAPRKNYCFYLVDDVAVVESDLKADAGTDKHIGLGDSVYIGRPMSSAVWCDWTVLGSSTILGKGPSIWVKPTTTTSYVVTQTLCGQTKKDTVKVEVWKLGVTSINGNTQHYSLSPNPATSSIQLYQEQEDLRPVVINVYDAVGRMVRNTEVALSNGKTEMSVVDLVPGIYYLHVRDTYGTAYNLKFVKN